MTDEEVRRPIRVMLVDDDPVVRTGLRFMLGVAADLEVVAEVSDGDVVVGAIQAHRPDVVVLDVRMARVGGIEAIAAIKARPEAPKVLMFTVFDTDDVARRAVAAGADGFLLKTASPEEICGGIRNIADGLGAVSPKTATQLFTHVREDPFATQRAEAARLVAALTPREREVVAGLARGLSNAELARELYVSETTAPKSVSARAGRSGEAGRRPLRADLPSHLSRDPSVLADDSSRVEVIVKPASRCQTAVASVSPMQTTKACHSTRT